MSKYILTLDAGTTSERAILCNKKAEIVHVAQKEFEQHYPKPGWVEHDAEEIWSTQKIVIDRLLSENLIASADIEAIGITNQRETTILWNKESGQPVHKAIVWQDRRTADYCQSLIQAGHEATIRGKTGLLIDAYFSATKLKWLLDHVPDARKLAYDGKLAFGTVDTWLLWNLTGGKVHATDVSNASRTMLYNIHTLEWDDELLALFDIPKSVLPEVRSSSEIFGTTSLFGGEIPIAGIAGDQQAALFGQLCTEPGMMKNTYGTGCFVVLNTGDKVVESKNKLLSTIAWQINGETSYALEGSIFIAGAVVQWIRDNVNFIDEAAEIESLANSVEDNGGVFFVPSFVGLGAPHWDPYSTGMLIGLTRGTRKGHIARAALESIALQTHEVIETMKKDAQISISDLNVDGGASANNLLMQLQADLAQVNIHRPKVIETTAMGAAFLAGLATGFWQNIQELRQERSIEKTFEPSHQDVSEIRATWTKAVNRAKNWNHSHEP